VPSRKGVRRAKHKKDGESEGDEGGKKAPGPNPVGLSRIEEEVE